jgi:hypothetical protein
MSKDRILSKCNGIVRDTFPSIRFDPIHLESAFNEKPRYTRRQIRSAEKGGANQGGVVSIEKFFLQAAQEKKKKLTGILIRK